MSIFINYLVPFFWLLFIALLLRRNRYFVTNGTTAKWIALFFIAKCATGITYNYISIHYLPNGGDVSIYYTEGLNLYKAFMHSPLVAFKMVGQMFNLNNLNIMDSHSSFVNWVFDGIKLIYFFLDFFSFGNLYTDTILFNGFAVFAFLHAGVFFRKHLRSIFPFRWIFLMPSAFFYTSAIFKEALALVLMCFILPLAYKLYKSASLSNYVLLAFLFMLFFFLKFLIAFTFLAALLLWWLMLRFPRQKKLTIISCIILGVACFFSIGLVSPKLNMQQYLIKRQEEFLSLDAHSKITVPHLEPTFTSFFMSLPPALNNVLFKPLPGEGGKKFYFVFTIEMIGFWSLLLVAWYKNKWKTNFKNVPILVWSLLIFAIINLLIIGYTIPNIGAITRYRSIFLPFIGLFFWMAFNGNCLVPLVFDKCKPNTGQIE